MSEARTRELVETPTAEAVLAVLRAHEAELRAAGVTRLSIFGSVARGDATPESDVDVVVGLAHRESGFRYFGQVEALAEQLRGMLDRPVDVVVAPVQKERLRRRIEKDAIIAFE